MVSHTRLAQSACVPGSTDDVALALIGQARRGCTVERDSLLCLSLCLILVNCLS
jgi:hypothetical protein